MHAVFVGTQLNPPVTFVSMWTHLLIALLHTRTQPPIAFVRTRTHPLVAIVGRASRPHVTWIVIRLHLCPLAGPHSPPHHCVFVGMRLHPPVAIIRTRTHPLVSIVRMRARLPVVLSMPYPTRSSSLSAVIEQTKIRGFHSEIKVPLEANCTSNLLRPSVREETAARVNAARYGYHNQRSFGLISTLTEKAGLFKSVFNSLRLRIYKLLGILDIENNLPLPTLLDMRFAKTAMFLQLICIVSIYGAVMHDRETNAARFRRGLGPLPPTWTWWEHNDLSLRASAAPCTRLSNNIGTLQIRILSNGERIGYLGKRFNRDNAYTVRPRPRCSAGDRSLY
ncbi:hypothetical protein B0H14DRAFT_3536777 [Mycena olivaceomarginata]|nr:hypothetical protein B0H14DRAFT_3536777 [Mycena olivaceomarginata]